MKKKGFTLVELLAVIAILAILVIIALPNVLGMFNSAKNNTFVVEVQTILDQANTQFMTESLTTPGSGITFDSTTAKKLDLSGNEKSYKVVMDSKGKVSELIVYDDNFCYDAVKAGVSDIVKTNIKVTDVYEGETGDSVTDGCKGTTKIEG